MPLTEHYAKFLLRKLDGRTSTVLEHRKYWDLTFLRLYLDHCDEVLFDDPGAGLELAKVAPKLATQIPKQKPQEWRYTAESEKREHRELTVRSHAVLGGAYRAGGRLQEAEDSYREARRMCASGPVGPTTRANLYKRLARLRSAQKRYDEALALIELAIELYRDRDQEYLADALLMKGYVLFEAGRNAASIPYFGEALRRTKPSPRSSSLVKRTFQSAVHNLAAAVSQSCGPDDVIIALRFVSEAKKFFSRKLSSINKHKLAWAEGRMAARLGSTRLAERRLLRAFKQLLRLGASLEAALVALDLSLIHHRHGEWVELEALAAETYTRFRELSSDTEALAALKLWRDGAGMRALSEANIVSARDKIELLVRKRRP